MEEKKRCPGCGAIFQSESEDHPGYLPPDKTPEEGVLCKRCFQMKHYAVYRKAPISDPGIQKSIKDKAADVTALFLVLDVSRPEVSLPDLDWVESFKKPIFLIANKADLLETWTDRKALHQWISDLTGVKRDQILLVSGQSRKDMTEMRHRIEDTFQPSDRLLFVGAANVGKSTILSALLKSDLPTVSRLPGTTVGMTEYQMKYGPVLVDAPGLKGEDPFLPVLCPYCLVALSPKKEFQTSIEVLKKGQTVAFGGLAQVTVADAGERGWVRFGIFAPDSVVCHRTREDRVEELLEKHSGELLTPPCVNCAGKLAALNWREESFQIHAEEDLAVPGIGWIALYSGACTVTLRAPDFIKGSVRPWLIPSPARRPAGKR